MEMPDAEVETAEGADGAGHLPEHSTGAAEATTKNGKHPRRDYDQEASEALVGG